MTAGIINNWKVIVQPSDATNAPLRTDLIMHQCYPISSSNQILYRQSFYQCHSSLIPIDTPIPPKPSDNQKIVTYKFSVCTAKKIETANTMKPTMAIKPLETNLDCPLRKILSEIAPKR